MLAFVTTLRHPQNSVSYDRVETLLAETLASVTGQDDPRYVVIIVGNKRPHFPLPDRVRFVEVGFPAPAPATGAQTAREPFVWDKGTKLGIGLAAAREFNPTHVMFFDADDFVHRSLARTVAQNSGHPGWVIRQGLMYSRARNSYRPHDDFNRTCGTSYIVPFDAYGVPADLHVGASQHEVAEAFGERLSAVMGAHRNAEAWFAQHGRTLESLPFPGAVYHVDTGENHSGKSMRGVARPFDRALADDFGVSPSRGRAATLWAAAGPVAVQESARLLSRKVLWRLTSLSRRLRRSGG